MKKILGVLILMLSVAFTGCSSDKSYINTVKSITFDNGKSVEDIVNENAKIGEFYFENDLQETLSNPYMFIFYLNGKDEAISQLKEAGIKMPVPDKLKWQVEGETSKGKVLIASNDMIKIKINTRQNGDYIELYEYDIQTFIKSTNQLIPLDMLEKTKTFYDFAVKNGYQGVDK